MKKTILIGILILLVTGCATSNREAMDSWLGSHQSEVIAQLGAPTRTTIDGKGGTILVYERDIYAGKYSYTASRMFYVNENEYVYHWMTKGY